jgi:enoyl-CoA hydratase/carnithine racemase
LADVLVPAGADPVEWFAGWIGGRSTRALDAAAALIRGRGGDVTERFAFARLFAAGEPREGLAAFLEKRRPEWT